MASAAPTVQVLFVGTHTGDFSGVSATGNHVRVPYSVFYDLDGDKIKALRIYMPMKQLLAQIAGATEPEVARSARGADESTDSLDSERHLTAPHTLTTPPGAHFRF